MSPIEIKRRLFGKLLLSSSSRWRDAATCLLARVAHKQTSKRPDWSLFATTICRWSQPPARKSLLNYAPSKIYRKTEKGFLLFLCSNQFACVCLMKDAKTHCLSCCSLVKGKTSSSCLRRDEKFKLDAAKCIEPLIQSHTVLKLLYAANSFI